MEPKQTGIIRIITCAVFKPALDHLQLETRFPNLRITYLKSNLHLQPLKLGESLVREFEAASQAGEKIVCLYGNCVPGIVDLCEVHGVLKVPGDFCHEMLLGPDRYREAIDQTAGTYFIEREVTANFDEFCRIPLELDDEKMKRYLFEHYQRLMYVRQPTDPDIQEQTKEIADFLGLTLEVQEADYSYLERKLIELFHF